MRSPSRMRRRLGAVVVAFTVLVAGCGVSAESRAHRADPEDVPFDLLEGEPTAPSPAPTGESVSVYFVRGDRLVEVERSLPEERDLDDLVEVLSAGPTEGELSSGITSSLPPGQVEDVSTLRGVALVDLEASFADLRTQDQSLAIAQLVYTLTGLPGIGRVSFTLAGNSVEVPRGDGALTTDALARDDFDVFAPEG